MQTSIADRCVNPQAVLGLAKQSFLNAWLVSGLIVSFSRGHALLGGTNFRSLFRRIRNPAYQSLVRPNARRNLTAAGQIFVMLDIREFYEIPIHLIFTFGSDKCTDHFT